MFRFKKICLPFSFSAYKINPMIINWYGEGCFKIQTEGTAILTDVFDGKTGLIPPRLKPDVSLKTIAALSQSGEFSGEETGTRVIDCAGEYEIGGIYIEGLPLAEESTREFSKIVFTVESEGLRLCFLGHLSEMPDPAIMEKIEEIDVLFIPAGGQPFLSQESAAKLIRQIEPKIVVPSFYKIAGLKRSSASLGDFLKETGAESEESEKLSVKKKDLGGKMKIMALKI